jgi:hypothetical protein
MKSFFGLFSKNKSSKDNFNYMQLRLSYSLETIEDIFNNIIEKRTNITVPTYMELRKAKSKDVYPYWVVFYLQNPEDFSQLIIDLGNGSMDEGRKI